MGELIMGELIYKDLKEIIGKAAEMLGTTAEKAYEIMYKQGNVKAALNIIVLISFIILTTIIIRTIIRYNTDEKFYNSFDIDDPIPTLVIVVSLIAFVLLFMLSIGGIVETTQILLNRDYWILQEVLKMLKK